MMGEIRRYSSYSSWCLVSQASWRGSSSAVRSLHQPEELERQACETELLCALFFWK